MKKTLIALAAVAVSSAAFAQNVTLSGAIAGGYNKSKSDEKAVIGMQVGELRIAASEDLGGGLTASGFLSIEGLNSRGGDVKPGNLTPAERPSNTDSGLSLAGGFGTVSLSNTRTSNLAANGNVFGTSISNGFYETVAGRANIQMLQYTSPELTAGLRAYVSQVYVGNTAASQEHKITVVGASYAQGPIRAGLQVKSLNQQSQDTLGQKKSQTEAFASYDLGVATVGVGFGGKTTEAGKAVTTLGVSAPVSGNVTLGLDYGKRGDAKFTNYGVRYAFSSRTAVHVSAGKYQTTANDSTNQSRVRLSHAF